ncbi:transketolase-like protein [Streptomyces sp. Ag109_O5-1]|nr:transketolase C-terminal domain-containing protein [Streptomyces sp. Ag109_O5-1]RPE45244.1 transketolase-like protein [Streptomyces sp. Ag109_O5-1]
MAIRKEARRTTSASRSAAPAEELAALARQDERVVVVCNDSVGSSNLVAFREEFPDRLVNVGIAEQNMVGVGAGLANAGFVPFVSAAGPFLTGRALEQIKADCAYSGFRVILCGQSPGMAYGELGPTHHSVEDLSWLRAVADLTVVVPADRAQTRAALRWAYTHDGPSYLRVPRFKIPDVTPPDAPFEHGRAQVLRDGGDVTLVAIGTLVSRALAAADRLAAEGTWNWRTRSPTATTSPTWSSSRATTCRTTRAPCCARSARRRPPTWRRPSGRGT